MNHRLISIAALITVAAMVLQAQKHPVESAASTVGWPSPPAGKFVASTEKTFDQLMVDAMSLMQRKCTTRNTPVILTMISLP